MLKIIEPKDHYLHKPRIEALLDLFQIYHNFELSSEEKSKTTFIIAEDETNGVYGGALLYKKKVGDLYDKIRKIISAFHPMGRKVWVAHLCLSLDQNEPFSAFNEFELCQDFYKNLLKRFIKFGRKKKTKFIILSLHPMASFKEKLYGQWSYLIEVPQKESTDGLFHGALGLTPQKPRSSRSFSTCLSKLGRSDL